MTRRESVIRRNLQRHYLRMLELITVNGLDKATASRQAFEELFGTVPAGKEFEAPRKIGVDKSA